MSLATGHTRAIDTTELDAALADSALATLRGLQLPALTAVLVFSLLLGIVRPGPWAVLWGVVSVGLELLWVALLRYYMQHVRPLGAAARVRFVRRLHALWAVNGGLWGGSVLLFVEAPVSMDLLACWVVVTCVGSLAVMTLAPYRPGLCWYVNCLAGGMVGSYVIHLLRAQDALLVEQAVLALLVLYWYLLNHIGQGQHAAFRGTYTLQQRNALLIESLSARSQALQEALDARRRFLAVATHDIRQPVHALRLYAEMLSQDPGMVDELSPRIVKSSLAVNGLFDNLFDLARLDWSRMRPVLEAVHLPELLADTEVQTRPQAEDKQLALRLRTSRRLQDAAVQTDRRMLQRVLVNLVVNAIKYTQRGGVLIALRGTPERPRLEVWDTGIGISEKDQAQVFQEFFKVSETPGTHEGFGLGLAIVGQLVSQLGCTVTLRSHPGHGSVFRVALPAATVQEPSAACSLPRHADPEWE
ncbi:MAG: HAMP domain-containing sensor histidine kinase [Pseudomonadota bacterium]|nr:HAMP domain-containing sensor histidine kinase [Pseudomonadota bacterium]